MIELYLISLIIIVFLIFNRFKEKFIDIIPYATETVTLEEINLLIDSVLNFINKKYDKQLVRNTIDRIEKTYIDELINYKIHVFIYNPDKFTNKKVFFNITYDKNKETLTINKIKSSYSRLILDIERNAITSRGTKLLDTKINIENVKAHNTLKHYKKLDYKSSLKKNPDRHSWILDKNAQKFDDKNNKPNRKVEHRWDTDGILYVKNDKGCGLNNSDYKFKKIPKFIVSNFVSNDSTDYDWLFDLTQDAASRPVGIGTARGG